MNRCAGNGQSSRRPSGIRRCGRVALRRGLSGDGTGERTVGGRHRVRVGNRPGRRHRLRPRRCRQGGRPPRSARNGRRPGIGHAAGGSCGDAQARRHRLVQGHRGAACRSRPARRPWCGPWRRCTTGRTSPRDSLRPTGYWHREGGCSRSSVRPPMDATGLASHGWTEQQAESFAAQCRTAGFDDVRVEGRGAGRGAVWSVRGVKP